MFEKSTARKSSPFARFLPWALVVFGLIVAGAFLLVDYLGTHEETLEGIVREGDSDFDRYRPFVELRDSSIQMGLNFARKRILMVSGVFANQGERAVDVVEVEVLFFNYNDQVARMVRTPIRPGPYTPAVEPLTERAISLYVEEIPQGWLSSHAEVAITGLRFASRN